MNKSFGVTSKVRVIFYRGVKNTRIASHT